MADITLEQFKELYQNQAVGIISQLKRLDKNAEYLKAAILRSAERDFENCPNITEVEASAVVLSHISEWLIGNGYKELSEKHEAKLSKWHCPRCNSGMASTYKRIHSGEYGIFCYAGCGYKEVKNGEKNG